MPGVVHPVQTWSRLPVTVRRPIMQGLPIFRLIVLASKEAERKVAILISADDNSRLWLLKSLSRHG